MLSVLFALAISIIFFYVLFIFPFVLVRLFRRNSKSNGKINRLKTVDEFDFFKQVQIDNDRGYCSIYHGDSYKTYIDSKGYRRFKDSNYLFHRWIVEKNICRKLRRHEVVHHKDRNKLNNSLDNLVVMHEWEHKIIHKDYLTRIGVLNRL